MSEVQILDCAAQAMATQRSALEYLARNVAAASVSDANGYERFVPQIHADGEQLKLVVHTQHHAAGGNVTEMLAVLDAQRAYEADASLFATGKRLVERTLDLERT
jgi:flagellar basal body rod protein FlgC